MGMIRKYAALGAGMALLSAPAGAAGAPALSPGAVMVAERAADVTGDGVADQIYLVGRRDAGDRLLRDANVIVEDGATKAVVRSAFRNASGYGGQLETGDFNGDKIADVLFALQDGGQMARIYMIDFHASPPRVIFQTAAASARSGEVVITKADHDQLVRVRKGSIIQLRLPENPTTGYTWQFTYNSGGDQLEFLNQQAFIPAAPAAAGQPGLRVFTFLAKTAGVIEMRLADYRVWESAEQAIDRFAVAVEICG